MSEKEQTQEQAPAPFAVGDKVRCVVDAHGPDGYLTINVVYEIRDFADGHIRTKGGSLFWSPRRFVPAVPFVDGFGKCWLVVDERLPKKGEHAVNAQLNIVEVAAHDFTCLVCKIVVPWQEFPAPEAKAEPWATSTRVETEIEALAGKLARAESERDNARRELALVGGVLDGTQHVLTGRSEGTDKALGVMAERDRVTEANGRLAADLRRVEDERDNFKASVGSVWSVINANAYPVNGDCLTQVVERLLVGQRPDRSDWQVKCAEARNERDAALARVAELEATEKCYEQQVRDLKGCINSAYENREDGPILLTDIARTIAGQYPDAEVVMVKVRGDGSIAFVPTTQGALDEAQDALAKALAGKREGNNG